MSPKQGYSSNMKPDTDYRTEKASRLQVKNNFVSSSKQDSGANEREERKREMMAKLHDLRMKVSTPSKGRDSLEGKYESKISSKLDSRIESKQSSSQKYYEPKHKSQDVSVDPAIMERLMSLESLVLNVKNQLQDQSPRKSKNKAGDSKIKEIGDNMERLESICDQFASQDEAQIEMVVRIPLT